jgi:hypothetical protein
VENYSEILQGLFSSYTALGCHVSLKLHFLHCHLNLFCWKQASCLQWIWQRFQQDVFQTEKRYGGKWSPDMLADYCTILKRGHQMANIKGIRRSVFN